VTCRPGAKVLWMTPASNGEKNNQPRVMTNPSSPTLWPFEFL